MFRNRNTIGYRKQIIMKYFINNCLLLEFFIDLFNYVIENWF